MALGCSACILRRTRRGASHFDTKNVRTEARTGQASGWIGSAVGFAVGFAPDLAVGTHHARLGTASRTKGKHKAWHFPFACQNLELSLFCRMTLTSKLGSRTSVEVQFFIDVGLLSFVSPVLLVCAWEKGAICVDPETGTLARRPSRPGARSLAGGTFGFGIAGSCQGPVGQNTESIFRRTRARLSRWHVSEGSGPCCFPRLVVIAASCTAAVAVG